MRITRIIFLLLTGLRVLSAGEIDGGILLSHSGGRSLDGVAKESEFNVGFRLGVDLVKFGPCQTRLAFTRHRGDKDDPIFTPSGPRQGLNQSDASIALEGSWRHGLEWGGAIEVRRDYLSFDGWPLVGVGPAETRYDRIWFKAYAANVPRPGKFSPLVRAEIGFTPQHGNAVGLTSSESEMKALAPNFHLTLVFGIRFSGFGPS